MKMSAVIREGALYAARLISTIHFFPAHYISKKKYDSYTVEK